MIKQFLLCSLILGVLGCIGHAPGEADTEFEPALIDESGRPSLGHLKHRDQMHSLRDLMDPAYRAAHDDDFVREFSSRPTFAIAGQPRSVITHSQHIQQDVVIWASMNDHSILSSSTEFP